MLHLKAWMVKSEVLVETLVYECATWTPLKGPYRTPYNTSQDVTSNSRSLAQVAKQSHPLLQRHPQVNWI